MLDANSDYDWDVIGYADNEKGVYITLLYIWGGKLFGRKSWTFIDIQGDEGENLSQFIFQYYDLNCIPPLVLLPVRLKDSVAMEEGILKKSKIHVKFQVPKIGKKHNFGFAHIKDPPLGILHEINTRVNGNSLCLVL